MKLKDPAEFTFGGAVWERDYEPIYWLTWGKAHYIICHCIGTFDKEVYKEGGGGSRGLPCLCMASA